MQKLAIVINYAAKKYFLKGCARLMKNANHFAVCTDKFLNHASIRKPLDTHISFYVEVPSCGNQNTWCHRLW